MGKEIDEGRVQGHRGWEFGWLGAADSIEAISTQKILNPELVKKGAKPGWDAKMLRVLDIAHLCTADEVSQRC